MLSKLKAALGVDAKSKGGLKSQLIFGASGIFSMRVGNIALVLATSIILARLLGPSGYGVYSFSMSLAEVLVVPSLFGLQQLLVREIPAFQTKQAWPFLRGMLRRSNQVVLTISVTLAILVVISGTFFFDDLSSPNYLTLCLAMLLALIMAQTRMRMSILRGLRHVLMAQLPQMVFRPGIFVIFLCLAYFAVQIELDSYQAMGLHVVAAVITLSVIFVVLRRAAPNQIKGIDPDYETSRWFWSALPLMFASCMNVLNRQSSILLLGALSTSDQVGLYRVAQRGAEMIPFALMAVNMTIAPTVSKLYTEGDLHKIQRILTTSARAILAFSLPAGLVLIIFGPWLVPFVFGEDFAFAAYPLAILCIGQLMNVGMGSVGLVLNMTGYEKDTAKGVAIAAVVNVILNIALIPLWGVIGAAIATSAALFIWNILLTYWVFKRTGLHTTALGRTFRRD